MAIIWDEKYSVGISSIDEQHKQFIFIMDKFSKAIGEGKTKDVIDHIFLELEEYVNYHFGTEETYFKDFNYVGTDEHIEAHRNFEIKLKEIKEKYINDENRAASKLTDLLFDWLTNHIKTLDRKYIECFRQNGLI